VKGIDKSHMTRLEDAAFVEQRQREQAKRQAHTLLAGRILLASRRAAVKRSK
jgi:hypothetical protein